MSEAETHVIVGQCKEESKRGDWVTFHVSVPGKDYPVKLATKKTEMIEQARSVGEQVATWTFTERDGNENPNRPGTFYKNRYVENVVAGASAEAQAATSASVSNGGSNAGSSPAVQAFHPQLHEADRQRAILRQTCLKAGAELYANVVSLSGPEEDEADWPLEVMKAAQRFEQWVLRDMQSDDDLPF